MEAQGRRCPHARARLHCADKEQARAPHGPGALQRGEVTPSQLAPLGQGPPSHSPHPRAVSTRRAKNTPPPLRNRAHGAAC